MSADLQAKLRFTRPKDYVWYPDIKVSEALRKAKEMIQSPDKWTNKDFAVDENDQPIIFIDQNARKFSSEAAIMLIQGEYPMVNSGKLYLYRAIGKENKFDDTFLQFERNHTHDEVMAIFDKAIALAEADPEDGLIIDNYRWEPKRD